jgi:SAM-dependent methyltransferase
MTNQPAASGTDGAVDREAAAKYLGMYLAEAPLAPALWRASEATALSRIELPRPTLDIGAGFGEFARIFFKDRPLPELGIDIDRGELMRAAVDQPYGSIAQCDARRLPLATASLGSVISVSTLEHIPGVEAVLEEVGRVLRPGGVLAYTVPIRSFDENMLGHRVLGMASKGLAEKYSAFVNKRLTHVNIWPAERWDEITRAGGLVVDRVQPLFSPRATIAFETLMPAAFASRLWRQALGRRPPHPAPFIWAARRALLPLLQQESSRGSNLLVIAHKPA